MNRGAVIQTDPSATVTIKGESVLVLGSIHSPGGTISVSGGRGVRDGQDLFANEFRAFATVVLGPGSELSAASRAVLTPNAFGNRTGYVLPGGSISVSGNVVAESGALLDVSGSGAMLDFAPSYLGAAGVPLNSGLETKAAVAWVLFMYLAATRYQHVT